MCVFIPFVCAFALFAQGRILFSRCVCVCVFFIMGLVAAGYGALMSFEFKEKRFRQVSFR